MFHLKIPNRKLLSSLSHSFSCYSDRLSAQDILTVKKVIDYLYGKLYGDKGPVNSNDEKIDPLDCLELFCQGQVRLTETVYVVIT